MIGLTGNQIQNVLNKLMPQEEEHELYRVVKYHKDDIDNPKVIGASLTGSQTAQMLNDTKVIPGKEMLISEPMPSESYGLTKESYHGQG